MSPPDLLRLAALVALVGYLAFRHRPSLLRRPKPQPPRDRPALDASKLLPALHSVRHDYSTARRSPKLEAHRDQALKSALEEVRQTAYFRNREPDEEPDAKSR